MACLQAPPRHQGQPEPRRCVRILLSLGILLGLGSANAVEGPCDILQAAGQPCVAAHSTTRALYGAYDGGLYILQKPNMQRMTIGVVKAGGFADTAAHDQFCGPSKDCVILSVLDQSPMGNHLTQRHKLVPASQHPVHVGNGVKVYGMYFDPGYGYHVDNTTGVAKNNEPESIFAVMSGTHYNGRCCFDYGNSENSIIAKNSSLGAGTMEAIYFGNAHWQGNSGANPDNDPEGQDGPWVGADLECGMYYGGGNQTKVNNRSQPLKHPFVSLYLRGRTEGMVLKGGDATRGQLITMFDGPRPDCAIADTCNRHKDQGGCHLGPDGNCTYQPPKKQGAIILATGGDNSNGAMGKFYEGVMTKGVTDDKTDDAVQENIVAVGYKEIPLPPTPPATALGCYVDRSDEEGRDLAWCATKFMTTDDPVAECGGRCLSYKYFALENGHECRCGNSYGKYGKAKAAQSCSMPCTRDPKVMCGGFYFETVYSH